MRPQSKLQVRVVQLSRKLPKISEEVQEWIKEKILEHKAYQLKGGRIGCLDCGHIWYSKEFNKQVECPSCKTSLTVEVTKCLNFTQKKWIGVVDTLEEFQLNRFWEVGSHHKVGSPAHYYFYEIIQQWIIPGGKWEFVARNRSGSYYYMSENFQGDLDLRHRDNVNKYAINPWSIYPKIKVQPIYKRNGFKNSFHSADPFRLLKSLLDEPKIETLFKAKQYSLVRYFLYNYGGNELWPSMKICMRNNYIVKDASLWKDYIDLLIKFKKDILNAKYVCPKDLRKEHDILVAKKQAIDAARELERQRQREIDKAEKEKENQRWKNPRYFKKKFKHFLDLKFIDKELEITPLQSVSDFKEEGLALHHCVYTNDYHKKINSLCFSAKINGERTETIEVNLKKMEVSQCYGAYNKFSDYHDRILKLMKKNMKHIGKAYHQKMLEQQEEKNKLVQEFNQSLQTVNAA